MSQHKHNRLEQFDLVILVVSTVILLPANFSDLAFKYL